MIFGFDLDGCLDREPMRQLAHSLVAAGHKVVIITGVWPEGDWQNKVAKTNKLMDYNFAYDHATKGFVARDGFVIVFIAPEAQYSRDERLMSIAFQKGDICRRRGIDIMFDDSEHYIKHMPAFCGTQMVLVK